MKWPGVAVAVVLAATVLLLHYGSAHAADDCSDSFAHKCINVGETATIRVTNALLSTDCLDSHGNPVHELVRPDALGYPRTGGATATFDPPVFRAYVGSSTLSISTTVKTRPGNYTIEINGTGAVCGRYHGFTWRLLVRPTISGLRELWSFNGAHPARYPSEAVLTVLPENQPPYKWYLLSSNRWLRFPNNQRVITTIANRVKVSALLPTKPDEHATVFVGVGGGLSLLHEFHVRTPVFLRLLEGKHKVAPDRGYLSTWEYVAFDQYGYGLPADALPVTIAWISPQTRLFPNSNWVRATKGPRFLANPRRIQIRIVPQTQGGTPAAVGIPTPEAPNHGTTKVDCWKAAVYLGGDNTQQGVRVDTQVWLRFRDHATIEAETCP